MKLKLFEIVFSLFCLLTGGKCPSEFVECEDEPILAGEFLANEMRCLRVLFFGKR